MADDLDITVPRYKDDATERRSEWNRVHRRAMARLRQENAERYSALVADEAKRAGIRHKRRPARNPVSPLGDDI